MTHNWKPGDVATYDGHRVMLTEPITGDWYWIDDERDLRNIGRDAWDEAFRPLLVIDPENRAQIERLADMFCHSPSSGWVDQMQAALRSLIEPEPEEPTAWLAVVRDGNGDEWYRWADREHVRPWGHRRRIRADRAWSDLPHPVTVLFEGWQEATDE